MFLSQLKNKLRKNSLIINVLGLLLVSAFSAIYVTTHTAAGLAWSLNSNLADPSAHISISDVTTDSDGKTVIKNLDYRSDSLEILFGNISMDWNPLSIFSSQMIINNLSGQQLTVNFKHNGLENNPASNLSFPVAANVLQASIKDFVINSNGKTIYSIKDTTIENMFLEESFLADKIVLKNENGQWIKLSGRFGFASDSVINLTSESSLAIASLNTNVRAKGTLVGNVSQLRFLQYVSSPINAEVTGRILHLFTEPSWNIQSELRPTVITATSAERYIKDIRGNVIVNGKIDEFKINTDLTIIDMNGNTWITSTQAQSVAGIVRFVMDIKDKKSQTPSAIKLAGSFDLEELYSGTKQFSSVKMDGSWKNVFLPLNEQNTVKAKRGDLTFDGNTLLTRINAEDVKLNTYGPMIAKIALNTQLDTAGDLIFNGTAATSDGNLKLSGIMARKGKAYELDNLFLTGTNFTLVRKPQAHIIVSPNLAFVRKDKIMTSTGTIKIPTANIQLQDFRNTLSSISAFIDPRNGPVSSTGHVDIEFGKSVWMHGFGLNARVTGELLLRDLSNKQIVANGELRVLQGNYRIQSENQVLSGGHLKFDNQDIDNPELDLSVKREPSTSRDSKKIIGRLQKLFSDSNPTSVKEQINGKIILDTVQKKVAINVYP